VSGRYPRQEVEQAFQHLWQVGPVGEDWLAQVDLYTYCTRHRIPTGSDGFIVP